MSRRGRHQQAREISMNHHGAELLVILLWTCTPAFAQARTSVPVRWEWFVLLRFSDAGGSHQPCWMANLFA